MASESTRVGLIVERRKLDNPWVDYAWMPVQIFPDVPATAPWTPISTTEKAIKYYAGPVDLTLHATETGNYRENLESAQPLLWVALSVDGPEPPMEIVAVTGDPAEGEALTETGTYVVETVPMPPEIASWMARFVAEHHVERPFLKRRRDRAEPDVIHRGRPREDE